MNTGYRFQSQFNPSDDITVISEKLNREFKALERARNAGSTTNIIRNGTSGGGTGGSTTTIVVRLLDGSLVLSGITELVLDQTAGLILAALSSTAASISVTIAHVATTGLQGGTTAQYYHLTFSDYTKVTTETFVNMHLTGYLHQLAIAAPSNPTTDNMIVYIRKIAGTPNEVRYVTKDTNGDESILHSYTY